MLKSLKAIFFLLGFASMGLLQGRENPPPHIAVGGGYLEAGKHHSGGLAQIEYRWGHYYFWNIRPQAILIFPELKAVFLGLGIGAELYLAKNLIFIPSFTPGLYYKGEGRDLGYPLEFRSSIELAYEWNNGIRLGAQFYHISNASLSHRNPGVNAYTVLLAFPLCPYRKCVRY